MLQLSQDHGLFRKGVEFDFFFFFLSSNFIFKYFELAFCI